LHCRVLFLSPGKGLALVGEKDKRAGDGGIVADPDSHVPCDAQEGVDISNGLARWPVPDLRNLGIIGSAALIIALVPKDDDFRDCKGELGG
jgi:hypothetical protein